MRFELESWRKLYVAESAQHRLMSLFARGLRDMLLRYAEPDGTLLHNSEDIVRDLCKVLCADGKERRQVAAAVRELLSIGYLSEADGRLRITRYVDAQNAKSPGAQRQAKYIANRKGRDVTPSVTRDVTSDSDPPSRMTSHPTRRDETRRDESESPPAPPSRRDGPAPPPQAAGRTLAPDEWTDQETTIPADLLERPGTQALLRELSDKLGAPLASVQDAAQEFCGYWTIGEGAGKRRRHWPAKLREHVRRAHREHRLRAPGELQHEALDPVAERKRRAFAKLDALPRD